MTDYKECEICKTFTNENRLKILMALKNRPLNVSEIVKKTGLSQSVVSQNLSLMKLNGIVQSYKIKNFVNYKLKYPEILKVFKIIKKINEKIKKGD